jgi:hypothetical protein
LGRKIKGKEVAQDFRSGMSDNSVMAKYGLSPSQLNQLKEKLRSAGLLEEQPPAQAPSFGYTPNLYDELSECPSCGLKMKDGLDECPRCGVIVSKIAREKEKQAQAEKQKPVEFSEQLKSEAVMPRSKGPFMKLIFLLLICLAVAVYMVYFKGDEKVPEFASQLNIQEDEDGVKRLNGKAAGRFKSIIQKSSPNLGELDEDLGRAVNGQLNDMGDAADERYNKYMEESRRQGY